MFVEAENEILLFETPAAQNLTSLVDCSPQVLASEPWSESLD